MRFWGSVLWHDVSPMKATLHWLKAKKEFLFYCPSVPMVLFHQGQFASWQCLVISGDIFGCSNRLLHSWGSEVREAVEHPPMQDSPHLPRIIQPKYQTVKKPSPIIHSYWSLSLATSWRMPWILPQIQGKKKIIGSLSYRTFEVLLSMTPGSWVPVGSRVDLHSSPAADKLDRMDKLHKISQL